MNGYQIFAPANLPEHWVIEDAAGQLWIVPARANGWQARTPYRGHRESLRPVNQYSFTGLGVGE